MLWGGLKPIRSRVVLDALTLYALAHCSLDPLDARGSHQHKAILVLSCFATATTSGLTSRWTVSFPMIPIVLMQFCRYWLSTVGLGAVAIKIFSLILIGLSALLSILFPAVNISDPDGKYTVGIADLHIPVKDSGFVHDHVTVRLLYPSLEKSTRIPYFDVDTADRVCQNLMKIASPPPFRKLLFMLDQWKLSTIKAKRHAKPFFPSETPEMSGKETACHDKAKSKLPIAIYSHGLTGSAEIYSYQTMSLASRGTLVMSVVHSDGSAIGVKRKCSDFLDYDESIGELAGKKETYAEYARARRRQADYRSNEFTAAAHALLKLNECNIQELEELGISFVNKLDVSDFMAIGHSFGGATALISANRKAHLFSCCIVHDPAIDWCSDDCRRSLMAKARFEESDLEYNGGTGGYDSEVIEKNSSSVHDLDMLFLYSNQWKDYNWGEYRLIHDMFKRGQLGCANGPTDVAFIYNACHSEFSDSCMKLPLWLARLAKMTGPRNPHETAEEIATRTTEFIEEVRCKRRSKKKV